jgi:hypothetical protein
VKPDVSSRFSLTEAPPEGRIYVHRSALFRYEATGIMSQRGFTTVSHLDPVSLDHGH